MKHFTILIAAIFLSLVTMAQTPQSFKYQTVARNNAGEILASQNISFRMTIVQGDLPGTVVYTETHAATTNAAGLATLEIGRGTPVIGSFAIINWSITPIFLKTETDPAGGTTFVEMGTSELLSVPFALYSENTANNNDADADPTNELQNIAKDGQTVTLSNGGGSFTDEVTDADANPANELQTLTQNGLQVSLSQNGGTINVADNDNNPANELQTMSKAGNVVSLSQGGGSFTDENTTYTAGSGLQLTGTTFSNTAPDQTVSITPGTGITKSGTYPNFTIANSMPDKTVTLQGTGAATVAGTYPNFTINANPADTSATNELQTLAQNGNEVTLSKGGGVISVADNDSDPINELQIVTQTDYNVSLSQGGGSFISGVKSYSQTEIDAMTPYNGLTLFNSTTNCINFYAVNNWFESCGTCLPQPTIPNAGPDQILIGGSTTTLAGNAPVDGTGLWAIVTGEGGSFGDPTSPVSTFTGVPTTDYTLSWTISTSCANLSDNVNIRFWSCGLPLVVNHLASGGVAPVDKSVTYGTVTNIPGAPTKCWITSNLGASQQATAVGDATEASSGWYWLFNRKQGYKHDGTTRTPNTAWESSISENSDWTPANDPCTHELGAGWRIPTNAEWTAVDASGNWSNWNGPWNSALKMHAAGLLHASDGSLNDRGSTGYYWSSTQYSATDGWGLGFGSGFSYIYSLSKSYGFSLRCVRD